ncbi:hypothetical protein GSI01S_02_00180 [Gordonia sihwensis NBRC 108236]|uniref:DUF3027 domain-containing protein n=1 Tax=Gordonia sihwensis NBRC 108236 TaxID=1223544 RepID=L7LEP3_9ACTN|nr:hypothetical protein GSI01S_02_00180 [Gordonia sihwensis NBRC 108236]
MLRACLADPANRLRKVPDVHYPGPLLHTGRVSVAFENGALVDAVAFAREALIADGETPGEHLGARSEGEYAATHYFAAEVPGYRGWQWCVVVAGAPESRELTVSETVLLPGDGALLAPEWVPWVDRVAPGDLGPGDLLAAPADDPRLVPGQIDTLDVDPIDRDQVGQVSAEIGLGRKRLLSFEGRADAAQRWYDGEFGPDSAMARNARHSCGTCGFYLPLAGALHGAFGVCANELSADGRAVSAEYGCGAHSDVRPAPGNGSPAYDAFDDGAVEVVTLPAVPASDAPAGD